MENQFKALLVREEEEKFTSNIEQIHSLDLPQNDLLIKVSYSSVNYKDALSASGNKGVTRKFPHIPGIDAAGEVVSSTSTLFDPGDRVLVTGYDLGMNTWGGFSEYISVPANWAVKLPEGLSLFDSMAFGTAGLTAGLSVYHLLTNSITPESGKIVVSGATGGVGSVAVSILSKLGFEVLAISGKDQTAYLTNVLGAKEVIGRDEFVKKYDAKALAREEFAGGIDTVGGEILSGILKSSNYNATVTCCGNVAGAKLETSIFPFILRGIKLIGIDSVEQPIEDKEKIWKLLANEWKPDKLNNLVSEVSLNQLPDLFQKLLDGKAQGRYVVNIHP
ncbi:oxidoreductase [Algoriphagus jejuensis]|uniref:Oxidoreductase n=1 Tax=Algoriphagus jejuensis TaxID=419934 RepID=A0ABP3YD27_9BACT